jgi:hypothetical protein
MKTTRDQIVRFLVNHSDRNITFLTNVLMCQYGGKSAMLRGLYRLVLDGVDVRVADYSLDRIVVDGRNVPLVSLTGYAMAG